MTTPGPSIVIPLDEGAVARYVDPMDAARDLIAARAWRALSDRYPGIFPPGAASPEDVSDDIARRVLFDARVVHVLAEVPAPGAKVATWRLADGDPPADFLDAWTGSDAQTRRKAAWDAFRNANGGEGPVYAAWPQDGPAGPLGAA